MHLSTPDRIPARALRSDRGRDKARSGRLLYMHIFRHFKDEDEKTVEKSGLAYISCTLTQIHLKRSGFSHQVVIKVTHLSVCLSVCLSVILLSYLYTYLLSVRLSIFLPPCLSVW